MPIQNNGKEIIKGARNKKTGIWGVPLGTQQSENLVNNIMAQTSKPELAHYLHAALFSPTTASFLKAIKQVFLKTWPGLTEKFIKKHLEKSRNEKIVHLHTRRLGIQSTKAKPPVTDLGEKIKTNLVFCKTVYPSTTKEGKIYSDICGSFPTTSIRGNKYIYLMYVYECNAILTTAMKNRSDKEIIRVFASLTEDFKIRGINPGFHFMDN